MLKDFKKFALKGNVIDLAVGVVIGAAFGKIVTSLVNDIIMPLVGLLLGQIDFSNVFVKLGTKSNAPILKFGVFINNIIDFLIVSFAIFIVVRQINRFSKKTEEVKEATTKICPYCYSEIHKDAKKCAHCTSDL